MKNTTENREKYFAAHWGQAICDWEDENGVVICRNTTTEFVLRDSYIGDFHLVLTPLSEITDEDRSEILNKYATHIGEFIDPDHFHFVLLDYQDERFISDNLRDRGYAIPFQNLSVEELIERGWLKLKTK